MSTRIVGIFALALVAGCGGGGSGGGGSETSPKYLYVTAFDGPNVFPAATYGFAVDSHAELSAIPGFTPIGEGQNGGGPLVITPDSKLLYAASGDPFGSIAGYLINSDGTLTVVPNGSFAPADGVAGVVIDPTASYLYASSQTGNLYVLAINSATGALKPTSSATLTGSDLLLSSSAVITPDGRHLYQSYGYPSGPATQPNWLLQVAGFSIDATTGALSAVPGGPAKTSLNAGDVAGPMVIDPTGKFLYVAYLGAGTGGGVDAFLIDESSGALSSVLGSPFSVGDGVGPGSMAIDSSGKLLIVGLNQSSGSAPGNCLAVLAINSGTGALSAVPGSPFPPATYCGPVIADPSESLIYVGSGGGVLTGPTYVDVLSVNETSGALAPLSQITVPDDEAVGTSYMVLTH